VRPDEACDEFGVEAGLPHVRAAQHLARGGKGVDPHDRRGLTTLCRRLRGRSNLIRGVLRARG